MSYYCDKKIPFHECELSILRNAVDKAEDIKGYQMANSPEIKAIIEVVEKFIIDKKLVCYGGTAINNILPEKDQFYDKEKEIPDYDFLSPNALEHAKLLANKYYKLGYTEVEAKAGVHYGTYKVFVNYIPIADITQTNASMFKLLRKKAVKVQNILYLPPDMLRLNMYLELSRPAGDISRWEKVLKRLTLLNKNYPLISKDCNYNYFARKMETKKETNDDLFLMVRDSLIKSDVVFFGGYASNVFSKYMKAKNAKRIKQNPDFDVLSINAEEHANKLVSHLKNKNVENVTIIKHPKLDEYIPNHFEIKVGKDTIAFIYQTIACYSYNTIDIENVKVKIATIDTMLSLYLAFIYANRDYYDNNRILCMANFLFKIQQKNRLAQKGPLKRFTINCYGTQHTKESIKMEKNKKFEELKNERGTIKWDRWFLNYKPQQELKGKKKMTKKKHGKSKISKTKKNKK